MDFWRANPPFIYGMWLAPECIPEHEVPDDVREKIDRVDENVELVEFLEAHKRMRARFQAGADMLDGCKWDDWLRNLAAALTVECRRHRVPLAIQGVLWRWMWSPAGTRRHQCVPKDFMRDGLLGAEKFIDPDDGLLPSPNAGWDGMPTHYVVMRVDVEARAKDLQKAFSVAKAAIVGRPTRRGQPGRKGELAFIAADDLGDAIEALDRPSFIRPNRWETVKGDWHRYIEQRVVTQTLELAVHEMHKWRFPDADGLTTRAIRAELRSDETHDLLKRTFPPTDTHED